MSNDDLLFIEDDNKRKLFYRFTPAAIASNFVPLIVILNEEEIHFEHKMWNVLTPLNHFGHENRGSGRLDKSEDCSIQNLLQKLIHEIAEEYECEDHIYLYGSSMSGYGAILHGILCKANAVYAHTPHSRLQETKDDKTASKENDLTYLLSSGDHFPVFYLCNDETTDENNPRVDMSYFVEVCKKRDIKVHLDFCPKSEKDETQVIKEVLDFFERVASER